MICMYTNTHIHIYICIYTCRCLRASKRFLFSGGLLLRAREPLVPTQPLGRHICICIYIYIYGMSLYICMNIYTYKYKYT